MCFFFIYSHTHISVQVTVLNITSDLPPRAEKKFLQIPSLNETKSHYTLNRRNFQFWIAEKCVVTLFDIFIYYYILSNKYIHFTFALCNDYIEILN